MVAYGRQDTAQKGKGVMDTLMKPFTVQKYGNEQHARSLDPNHFMEGYRFVGPKTELLLREKMHDDVPLNDLDRAAKKHDYAYLREQTEYNQDHDKKKHIDNIWRADDEFINEAKNSYNDPIMGNISSKLIATKEMLEKNGIMDTKQFSGFGKKETKSTDPAARLRQLVKTKYKGQLKHDKKQSGGVLPLAPIAVAALGAVTAEIVKDIYGLIKRKLSGSGMKFNHKNNDKKLFLIQLLQSIK